MHDSPGRSEAGEKQMWLANAQLRERTAREQLAVARPLKRTKEIFIYRYQLAIALRDLGRFEEAIALITTEKGNALKECSELRKEIEWYRLAIYRDDNYECGCSRLVAAIPDPSRQNAEATIELRRRHRIGFCFSYKHNQVVEVWKCSRCQCLNAHDLGPPENQQAIHEARALVANPRVELSDREMAGFGDHVMLKK